MPLLGWDADGVLVDSRTAAWKAAEDIVRILGEHRPINSQSSYAQVFGRQAQTALVGETEAPTLRAMHRLAMRSRASSLKLFPDVASMLSDLPCKSVLVTAAFAEGIRVALGSYVDSFVSIHGREDAAKGILIRRAAQSDLIAYVTDGVRDIAECRTVGVRTVAVTWGYTPADILAAENPNYLVNTPSELKSVLLNLTHAYPKDQEHV